MKYLLILLSLHLLAVVAGAQTTPTYYYGYPYFDTTHPQQSTYEKGDSVWLESFDTNKVKVSKNDPWLSLFDMNDKPDSFFFANNKVVLSFTTGMGGTWYRNKDISPVFTLSIPTAKYDTIAGWHLVSDTAKGRWNPVSAMYLYEVRIYKNHDLGNGTSYYIMGESPNHVEWLDSNKKPFKLQVWQ